MTSPRGGRPEEGTPEYNWLYGTSDGTSSDDATRVVRRGDLGSGSPASPPPDATRALPADASAAPADDGPGGTRESPRQPRSSRYVEPQAPRSRATAPSPGADQYQAPPPPGTPPPAKPRRSSGGGGPRMPWLLRRALRPKLRWILYALILWIVYLVAVPVLAWNKVSAIENVFPAESNRPADQGGTTYLVVGSDSRDSLSKAERQELGTGGPVGQRTDTIMLLHSGDGPTTLTSIPRDSIVDIPGKGSAKINAAYAWGGPKLLIRTIEQNTGVKIDHYVEIGMGGVVEAVDAVGGIEICPKTDMKDPLANLDISKGCQEVDGKTALAYSRSRHAHTNGDIGRAEAQREVVGQVARKAVNPMSVINPVRYWKLWSTASSILRVDSDTGVVGAGKFALAMTGADQTCVVPLADLSVRWDPERAKKYFTYMKDDNLSEMPAGLCTATGFPATKP